MRRNLSRRVEARPPALVDAERELEAARAETALLHAALDALPLGVVVTEGDGRVVFRNLPARALTRARDAEVLAADAVEQLLAGARSGTAQHRRLELHGPPPRTLDLSVEPVVPDRAPAGAVVVIQDVSERRHLDAVRRDFVANVSHELRTPIGALAVLAEALAAADDPVVTRRLAVRMTAEAERAGRLIEDLLDLSRIEAGGAGGEGIVMVADVLTAAAERVRPLADQHDVKVRVGEADRALTVVGHEGQLVSAVANLLDNAVRYSDAGSPVDVDVRADDDWVEVAVTDVGMGIPARDLERIFERFYRVDRARSRKTGGTGLGLAIVRHVAANHRGEVTVQSREGEGSTFTLRLPRGT